MAYYGNGFFSGCLTRQDAPGSMCGFFGDHVQVIPENEWPQVIREHKPTIRPSVHRILDQGREGSCTSNAGTGCYETLANFRHNVKLTMSAMSLYKRCGRSAGSGSTVGCNMRKARDEGFLPATSMREVIRRIGLNPDHCHPETGFRHSLPSGWQETARHFRIGEFYEIRNLTEFGSALLQGYVVHYGRRGHSIYGVELSYAPQGTLLGRLYGAFNEWFRGDTYCEYPNSWGADWNRDGFGRDSMNGLRRSIDSYGAYAYRDIYLPEALLDVPELKV